MDLNEVEKATCWKIRVPENLLHRLQYVSGKISITTRVSKTGENPEPENEIHIFIDDELNRLTHALNTLSKHRLATTLANCPSAIPQEKLRSMPPVEQNSIVQAIKEARWQSLLVQARAELSFTGILLPNFDGTEPSLWPSAKMLLHRLELGIHDPYNSHNISVETLWEDVCFQESERVLCGLFPVNLLPSFPLGYTVWTVRNNLIERSVTKSFIVDKPTPYHVPHGIPVSSDGYARITFLIDSLDGRQQYGRIKGTNFESRLNALNHLRQTLRLHREAAVCAMMSVPESELSNAPSTENSQVSCLRGTTLWNHLCDLNFCVLASEFEKTLCGITKLQKRRSLQKILSLQQLGSSSVREGIFRSEKISISPGVFLVFVSFPQSYLALYRSGRIDLTSPEQNTKQTIYDCKAVLFGPSIQLDDLDSEYGDENKHRRLNQSYCGSSLPSKKVEADKTFLNERYAWLHDTTLTPYNPHDSNWEEFFALPETDSLDTADADHPISRETKKRAHAPVKRRKTHVDDALLKDTLINRLSDNVIPEGELYREFGRSQRFRALLRQIAYPIKEDRTLCSWKLKTEFARD